MRQILIILVFLTGIGHASRTPGNAYRVSLLHFIGDNNEAIVMTNQTELFEIWEDIAGYEGYYQISNLGRVKSLERIIVRSDGRNRTIPTRVLKLSVDSRGYHQVGLYKDGVRTLWLVHHLIWDTLGDEPRNGRTPQVDHIDDNKLNNQINNLQLLTQRENTTKAWAHKETSSKYPGVYWHKRDKKWQAGIRLDGNRVYLGSFKNEHDAHLAYDKAFEEYICLN